MRGTLGVILKAPNVVPRALTLDFSIINGSRRRPAVSGIPYKALTCLGLLSAVAATFLLIATVRTGEAECLCLFRAPYQDYLKQTKRLMPLLY